MITTILRRTLPVQCPACREHLGIGPAVGTCQVCSTAHHVPCLVELGCSSLNCATPGGTRQGPMETEDLTLPLGTDGAAVDVVCLVDPSALLDHDVLLFSIAPTCLAQPFYFVGTSNDDYELMAQWCEQHAPGLLSTPDYPEDLDNHGRCPECQDDATEDRCGHTEEAEQGMTYCDPGLWIDSHLWYLNVAIPPTAAAVRTWAFESVLLEDYDDILEGLEDLRDGVETYAEDHREATAHLGDVEPEPYSLDVRLRAHARWGVSWDLLSGDASYDQDHRGHWGSGSLSGDEGDIELRALLDSLVSQVCDAYAESL